MLQIFYKRNIVWIILQKGGCVYVVNSIKGGESVRKTIISMVLIVLCAVIVALAVYIAKNPIEAKPVLTLPLPSPSPSPEPSPEDVVRQIMNGMTAQEKAWQLLFVFPEDVVSSPVCTDLEEWAIAYRASPAGGFIIGSENMESEESLKSMLSCINHCGTISAFTGVDEEGGKVARLSYTLGVTTDFYAMYTYKEEGPDTAYSNANTIGSELKSFGFNLNFAPVADVWTNPENTVIGTRAYSDLPQEAATLVAAAVSGYEDAGVIPVLKHFPGHGDTLEDSHDGPAYSYKTLPELEKCEFLPFVTGIEANAGMVMISHIILTEIDPGKPSSMSEKVIGLLRDNLSYDGVIITDGMQMLAIEQDDEISACLAAIEAGCDILLAPENPQAVAAAITENISPERIDESVCRILQLKYNWGLL